MVNKLKIIKPLIIGIGLAGRRHLDTQLNLGIKTGIYTTNPETTKLLRGKDNIIVFDNLEEGIDWSNLVHVCTPDDKHTEYISLALKKGKAVLCEKTFTTNLKDALYIQNLAHKYNSTLVIGQNYRLTPTFLETKKRVSEGSLGKITKIETTYLHDVAEYQKRTPLRKNEDFLYIGGSHAVDLACWIVDDSVVSVQATATNTNPKSYQITLKFASGLMGNIKLDASLSQPRNGTDLIVEGENGKLVSHNKLDKLLFYKKESGSPQIIKLPNSHTFTIAKEIKIIDEYLLGKLKSFWPLPGVDEAVSIIKILDIIQRATS